MTTKENWAERATDFLTMKLMGWPLALLDAKSGWVRVLYFPVMLVWLIPGGILFIFPIVLTMLAAEVIDAYRGKP